MAMTLLLPLLVAIMILGFSTASTDIEIPFTSMLQLFLCIIAYWQLADLERTYLSEKMFSATMASFLPLNPNPDMSARERKLAKKYDFERQRIQTSFCRQMFNDVGIYEIQRLLGMANAVGNMSPVLNNTNPMIDLRERFDEFYHVRTAEWGGFYPTDMQMTPDVITDEYRDLVN